MRDGNSSEAYNKQKLHMIVLPDALYSRVNPKDAFSQLKHASARMEFYMMLKTKRHEVLRTSDTQLDNTSLPSPVRATFQVLLADFAATTLDELLATSVREYELIIQVIKKLHGTGRGRLSRKKTERVNKAIVAGRKLAFALPAHEIESVIGSPFFLGQQSLIVYDPTADVYICAPLDGEASKLVAITGNRKQVAWRDGEWVESPCLKRHFVGSLAIRGAPLALACGHC